MKLIIPMVLAATASVRAEPGEPLVVVENWHRADMTGHIRWTPLEGTRVLAPDEFLALAGEVDLARANRVKRTAGIWLSIGGSFALPATLMLAFTHHETAAWVTGVGGAAMLGGGIYELATIHYLTATEAHQLADRYNATHVVSWRRTF